MPEVVHYCLNRMAGTPAPLKEKMALFWHGHFTSHAGESRPGNVWTLYKLLYAGGMGSFVDLTQKVAIHPAMLLWLTNHDNKLGHMNENFGRELMELFTLGVDQYTQEDVVAATRAWTGHNSGTGPPPGNGVDKYKFWPERHDNGNKTFFGTTKNWDGPDIINEICTGAKKQICARHIAKKMWTFFAYENPSDALLNDLANAFLANGLIVKDLLRAIFLRPEFYSTQSKQGHVRSPTEFVVAIMRYTGAPAEELKADSFMADMGQSLFLPPNVAGWRGKAAWVSASATYARIRFSMQPATDSAVARGVLAGVAQMPVRDAVLKAFQTFGIPQPTAASLAVVEKALTEERTRPDGHSNLLALVTLSPEFQMG